MKRVEAITGGKIVLPSGPEGLQTRPAQSWPTRSAPRLHTNSSPSSTAGSPSRGDKNPKRDDGPDQQRRPQAPPRAGSPKPATADSCHPASEGRCAGITTAESNCSRSTPSRAESRIGFWSANKL
jgi:hypothetical protein